ncbi:MAG: hypothetical protein A2X78_04625 [Gammaproteobacteria bacterium GWE2_37_16]|nr:MAG: hypothetical protein A2X78_04625 [Gammaproteobacteria bacterium GWE2_37_16]
MFASASVPQTVQEQPVDQTANSRGTEGNDSSPDSPSSTNSTPAETLSKKDLKAALREAAEAAAEYYDLQDKTDNKIIELQFVVYASPQAATKDANNLKKLYTERDTREAALSEYNNELDDNIEEILRTGSGVLPSLEESKASDADEALYTQKKALHKEKTALLKLFQGIKKDDPNFQAAAALEQLRMIAVCTCDRYKSDDRGDKLEQDFRNCLVQPTGKYKVAPVLQIVGDDGEKYKVKGKLGKLGQLVLAFNTSFELFGNVEKYSVKTMLKLLEAAKKQGWRDIKIDFGTAAQREAAREWLLQNPEMQGAFGTGNEGVTDEKGKQGNERGEPAAEETAKSRKLDEILTSRNKCGHDLVKFFNEMNQKPEMQQLFKETAGKGGVDKSGVDPLARVLSRYHDTMMAKHRLEHSNNTPEEFSKRARLAKDFYSAVATLGGDGIEKAVKNIEDDSLHKRKRLDWLRSEAQVIGVDSSTPAAPSKTGGASSQPPASLGSRNESSTGLPRSGGRGP